MTSNIIYIQKIKDISIDNKYTRWYIDIIVNARNRIDVNKSKSFQRKEAKALLGYVEGHHIFPSSICEDDAQKKDKNNFAYLTAKEHFICHLLLTKMFLCNRNTNKMKFAVWNFVNDNRGKARGNISSRKYQKIKEVFSSMMRERTGENNPFFGRTHSKETKELISSKNRERAIGENNPFFGRTHSKETKELISSKNKNKIYCKGGIVIDKTDEEKYSQFRLGYFEHTSKGRDMITLFDKESQNWVYIHKKEYAESKDRYQPAFLRNIKSGKDNHTAGTMTVVDISGKPLGVRISTTDPRYNVTLFHPRSKIFKEMHELWLRNKVQ